MKRRTVLKYAAAGIPLAVLRSELTRGKKQRENARPANETMKIQRLPWAGLKIVIGNTTLFVDATSYETQGDMKLTVESEHCHAVISHHHTDHYDPDSLKKIFKRNSRLFCHESVLPWIDNRDLRVQTTAMYQPVDVSRWMGDFIIIPVPAVDGFGHPQVSWIIQGGGKKIIHCGDTLWHGYWRDIAIAYGPFDVAFVPINGARLNQGEVKDMGIPAVLMPQQAAVAAKLLAAKAACPIHYGRAGNNYFETPDPEMHFLRYCKEIGVHALVVTPGEHIAW